MPIHVAVRVRPVPPHEEHACNIVGKGRHVGLIHNGVELRFNIPRLFGEPTTNREIADSILPSAIDKAIGGYISAIIAYGQTNSGKTYTILGDECLFADKDQRKRSRSAKKPSVTSPEEGTDILNEAQPNQEGLIVQGLRRIYSLGFIVKLSFLEVYREKLYDLLTCHTPYSVLPDPDNGSDRNYYNSSSISSLLSQINMSTAPQIQQTTGTFKNLNEIVCSTLDHAIISLKNACGRRMTASTARNEVSSRSHFLTIVTVLRKGDLDSANAKPIILGKIYFCDLAGSERFDSFGKPLSIGSQFPGQKAKEERRLAEGININKSLLMLRKVLEDLAAHKNHIPYRASTLTKILQVPFENGYVTFLATVNPANFQETKRTLDYACITRQITFARMPTAVTSNFHDLSAICHDCMNKVLTGKIKTNEQLVTLFCRLCGTKITETKEYYMSHNDCTHITDKMESFRYKPDSSLPRSTEECQNYGAINYTSMSALGLNHKNKLNSSTNNAVRLSDRHYFSEQQAYSVDEDAIDRRNIDQNLLAIHISSNGLKERRELSTRPISAIDVVSQECMTPDPANQLASIASLLYSMDSQADDTVRDSLAIEDRSAGTTEVSMQTVSEKAPLSDGNSEKDEREESPSVWSVYASALHKTQIHLPHGATKGMTLQKLSPNILQSYREYNKNSEESRSHSVMDMLEESNFLIKSSMKLSTNERTNKKANMIYLLAVVCNEILETKRFEIDELNYSNLCLEQLYMALTRNICSSMPSYSKFSAENSADYKVLIYKLEKKSTLTPYNYEQLRMDVFSETYCQVDVLFDNFITAIKKFEQMDTKGENITKEMIMMATEALISNLTRTVLTTIYECFDTLLEETDTSISLSSTNAKWDAYGSDASSNFLNQFLVK